MLPRALVLPALLLFSAGVFADTERILHTPPGPVHESSAVAISFTISGGGTVLSADLFVRSTDEETFARLPAEKRNGAYSARVPSETVKFPWFEYYVLVLTEDGRRITSPAGNPMKTPHTVTVIPTGRPREETTRIVILSPEPEEIIESTEGLIVSALFDPPLLPPGQTVLYLDGREITDGVEVTEDYILYHPPHPLDNGAHEVTVILIDEEGRDFERDWIFYLREAGGGGHDYFLTGKAEAGWSSVRSADVGGDPFLPYEETSSLMFDLYAYGSWNERSIYFSASRNPIFDNEVRVTGRISGDRFRLEAGDIFPSFTELSVSWLSGDGGFLSCNRGRLNESAFFLRTISSDTTGGFGTYSQYVAGNRIAYTAGRWESGVNAAYGWEDESSVPDSIRFLSPIRNLVLTGNGRLKFTKETRLDLEVGWSDTDGDDSTEAAASRIVLTLLDSKDRRFYVEYHDYAPGYYTLGNPTIDGGERGFLFDGFLRPWSFIRQTLRAEIYKDSESSQEIEEGKNTVQLYGRTDLDWKNGGTSWNTYFLFRTYTIPYADVPYTSRYGTAGVYVRRGSHTLSLNGTQSESRSLSEIDTWMGSGYLSGSIGGGRFSWKIGERYTCSETKQDTLDAGSLEVLSETERWTFNADLSLLLRGLEWRAEYEKIREDDPAQKERFIQHLFSLTIARRF